MDEPQRNRLFLVLVIGFVVMAIVTFVASSTAYRQKVARDQEMVQRLEIEEKMNKIAQDEQARDSSVKRLQQDIEAERLRHQATKEALVHEQLASQVLREELRKRTADQQAHLDSEQSAVPAAGQN